MKTYMLAQVLGDDNINEVVYLAWRYHAAMYLYHYLSALQDEFCDVLLCLDASIACQEKYEQLCDMIKIMKYGLVKVTQ